MCKYFQIFPVIREQVDRAARDRYLFSTLSEIKSLSSQDGKKSVMDGAEFVWLNQPHCQVATTI